MNIYVGNLSYEVTEDELQKAFEEFGEVESAKIIKDMYSGRSKGFGFVEMPTESDGNAAIEGLDSKELKGRAVKRANARLRQRTRPDALSTSLLQRMRGLRKCGAFAALGLDWKCVRSRKPRRPEDR